MATLTNQNQWYDVATAGPYTTTISGSTAVWTNVIQARWTSLSGTTYSVEYRCVLRKSSGSLIWNTSSYDGYSIGGTGANTVSASNVTINFPNNGDNVIATTYGSINGTSGSVFGGVKLGYYGTTWGGTGLSGSITLPSPYTAPTTPTISSSNLSFDSVDIVYGTASFGYPSTGTVTLYGGTSPHLTTVLDTSSTTGNNTFSHTGLTPGTTYYYRAKASNGQLDSGYSTEISVTTKTVKLYGSVNGETKKINKLYGSVRTPLNVYYVTSIENNTLSVNTFNNSFRAKFYNWITKQPVYFRFHGSAYSNGEIELLFSDNTGVVLSSWSDFSGYSSACTTWGFVNRAMTTGNVSSQSVVEYQWLSKKINKLYGSVNGKTKLIFLGQ